MERLKGGWGGGGSARSGGASNFSLPRTREEMAYFSSPSPLPKSKDFPFLVCEMQEGNLGKGCGQASAHTPDIPFPTTLPSVWEEADPETWLRFHASPLHRCWLWLGARQQREAKGLRDPR